MFAGAENETFEGTPDDAIAYFGALVATGLRYFIVGGAPKTLRRLAEEVMPAVQVQSAEAVGA